MSVPTDQDLAEMRQRHKEAVRGAFAGAALSIGEMLIADCATVPMRAIASHLSVLRKSMDGALRAVDAEYDRLELEAKEQAP